MSWRYIHNVYWRNISARQSQTAPWEYTTFEMLTITTHSGSSLGVNKGTRAALVRWSLSKRLQTQQALTSTFHICYLGELVQGHTGEWELICAHLFWSIDWQHHRMLLPDKDFILHQRVEQSNHIYWYIIMRSHLNTYTNIMIMLWKSRRWRDIDTWLYRNLGIWVAISFSEWVNKTNHHSSLHTAKQPDVLVLIRVGSSTRTFLLLSSHLHASLEKSRCS